MTDSTATSTSEKKPAAKPAAKPAGKTVQVKKQEPEKVIDMSTDDEPQAAATLADKQADPVSTSVDPASLLLTASPVTKPVLFADNRVDSQRMSEWLASPRPVLAMASGVPDTYDGKVVEIRLYAEGCLDCSDLVPSVENEGDHPDCHFSKGNVYCPAAHLRIRFVGAQLRLISKIKKAQAKQDVNRISVLMTELEKLDLDSRREILKEIGLFKSE